MDHSVKQMIENEVHFFAESEQRLRGKVLSPDQIDEIRRDLFEFWEKGQWEEVFDS